MLDGFPTELLTGGGVVGLITAFGWALARGLIVTRREHDNRIGDKDAQIAYLRETLATRDQEAAVRSEQIGKLLTNTDLTVQLLQGVHREATRGDMAT